MCLNPEFNIVISLKSIEFLNIWLFAYSLDNIVSGQCSKDYCCISRPNKEHPCAIFSDIMTKTRLAVHVFTLKVTEVRGPICKK